MRVQIREKGSEWPPSVLGRCCTVRHSGHFYRCVLHRARVAFRASLSRASLPGDLSTTACSSFSLSHWLELGPDAWAWSAASRRAQNGRERQLYLRACAALRSCKTAAKKSGDGQAEGPASGDCGQRRSLTRTLGSCRRGPVGAVADAASDLAVAVAASLKKWFAVSKHTKLQGETMLKLCS